MQSNNKYLLDPHLNIFYSYDRGGKSNKKDEKNKLSQLEDNVTRAFIITLSNLSYENRQQIIKMMIGEENFNDNKDDFFFDLQNLSEDCLNKRNGASKKILLTITRTGEVSEISDTSKDDQGSRADGWIINDEIAVLLEVKIRNAEVSRSQIERHIGDSKGFGELNITCVNQVHKKWHEVDSFFSQLEENLTQDLEKLFVFQFRKFLNMIGETMNFRQFYENIDLVDDNIRKNQLKLLVDRVCTELSDNDFKVGNETKDWGYLNYKGEKNPHISFAILESKIVCYLTVSEGKQKKFKSLLLNKGFNKELKSFLGLDYITKARYFLSLENYRVIDYVKGQMRGENHSTFSIKLNFCENDLNENRLNDVIAAMTNCLALGKQFEFGLTIDFPKNGSLTENGLMEANKSLLEAPDQLISLFVDFIKTHKGLLESISNS